MAGFEVGELGFAGHGAPAVRVLLRRSVVPAETQEDGARAGRGDVDADAGGLFDDAGANLEQAQPESGELGACERHRTGNCVAQGEHQPVGTGVQDQLAFPPNIRNARLASSIS